jgi:hypothetical protein
MLHNDPKLSDSVNYLADKLAPLLDKHRIQSKNQLLSDIMFVTRQPSSDATFSLNQFYEADAKKKDDSGADEIEVTDSSAASLPKRDSFSNETEYEN